MNIFWMSLIVFVFLDILILGYVWKKRRKAGIQLAQSLRPLWQKVLKTNNATLQIIEADKVLDRLLTLLGYYGSVGEKLKQACGNKHIPVDLFWKVHKKRNELAHDFQSPMLEKEAKKYIMTCQQIFRELNIPF